MAARMNECECIKKHLAVFFFLLMLFLLGFFSFSSSFICHRSRISNSLMLVATRPDETRLGAKRGEADMAKGRGWKEKRLYTFSIPSLYS